MPTVTLADVAERAGVTVPTASKVLNGRTDVSAATRARVLAAVAESGYQGRRPRRGDDSGLVDLVISGVEGTWANRALSGVEHTANLVGLDVVVTVARPAADRDWASRLLARRSGGAVLALVEPTATQWAALDVAGIPVVLLDPRTEPLAGVPSVGAGNWAGGRAAAGRPPSTCWTWATGTSACSPVPRITCTARRAWTASVRRCASAAWTCAPRTCCTPTGRTGARRRPP